MNKQHRFARRVVGAAACVALTAGALATGAVAAPRQSHPVPLTHARTVLSASSAVHQADALGVTGTLHYAVETPTCAKPVAPDYYTCFAVRRTIVAKSTKGAVPYVEPASSAGPAGGLTPTDLADAYGYNPKLNVKQTIGIVDWYDDPHALADLNAFDKHYHLPKETSTSFRKVNQYGKTANLPKADKNSSTEITLDIQSARAVCQKCRIILIEATNPSDADLAQAENEVVKLGATEVSNSFGSAETSHKMTKATIQAYNHPGVVITASTGDEGWFGWDFAKQTGGKSQNSALFPSTDNAVVAVGGTRLYLTNKNKRAAELVWDDDAYQNESGATGGGCSVLFAAAPWQKAYANYGASNCGGGRLAADVSADADPVTGFDIYQTYGGTGWETVGGTSLASPVTAAMWALAGGARGAAYPSSALYLNAHLYPSSVYDVTALEPTEFPSGNSACYGESPSTCDSNYGGNPNALGVGLVDCSLPRDGSAPTGTVAESRECNVAKGLDGPTGLGTPKSLRLFTATTPTLSLTGPGTVKPGKRTAYRAKAKESIPRTKVQGYEFLWGDGSKSTTRSGSTSHTYKHTGKYTVTILVVDNRDQETIKKVRITVKK